ncbi:MAG: hypothetical protein RLZZ126_2137 [Pseudomonadota bacterium]
MTPVQWSEELELGLPYMDETHREFVELLARAVDAPDSELLAVWKNVMAHTADHFDREDQWMRHTAFPPGDCHTNEHQAILAVMAEAARRGTGDVGTPGNLGLVRQLAQELGVWFAGHAQSMDAALALFLKEVQYDETTGLVAKPYVHPVDEPRPVAACSPG